MRKRVIYFLFVYLSVLIVFPSISLKCYASNVPNYYTVYADETKSKILFLKGNDVSEGDEYLSNDNKLYEIHEVDDKNKTAIAKYIRDEKLPEYNVKYSADKVVKAYSPKVVGIYHTHNDESYFTPDGVDSVYGKGGIHDVGKALKSNFEKLGVNVIYREDLHLPHNSGAYTRSQVTASALLNEGAGAIFDIHRDSTKRSEYLAKVNGEQMSAIRLVIGAASANYEENKKFAYSIKAYADKVYPGLIKDIYTGKGNYNQQLSSRAMLFEMGCENIEKDLVIKSTENLSKTLDVVLYGTGGASNLSLNDVSLEGENAEITGIMSVSSQVNSNATLGTILYIMFSVAVVFMVLFLVWPKFRYKTGRFFSELFAGLFGKRKVQK